MATDKSKLRFGLIGTGFMGKAHALGLAAAGRVFDLPREIVLHKVADVSRDGAEAAAKAYGFATATGDWRELVADPAIDVINVTAPNALHKEMTLAAVAAGKHVYCEKPLAPLAADALQMAEAAEAAQVKTQVGFNYLCNPMFALAREMIRAGEIGEVVSFRGVHAEDYMFDPASPFTFRHDPVGGGATADLASHVLATAEYLVGPIAEVVGDCVNVIDSRPDGKGGRRDVITDDIGRALVRFAGGATGSIEASWVATGRKMQHDFEVYGTRGGLHFSQERFNELHYFSAADQAGRQGYRKIEAGPPHQPYGLFCVATGHQLGFNDLKSIEVARFVQAIAGEAPEPFNFRAGLRIQHLVETIQRSSKERRWLKA